MHNMYDTNDINVWLDYYGNQALQTGFGIEGYRGLPYQRGAGLGSFFRSLFRMAVPLLKSAGRQVGKHALSASANIMSDLAKGRPAVESVKRHSRDETSKLLREAGEALQEGEGLGIMPKSINTGNYDVFAKKARHRKNVTDKRKVRTQY
jgi:hypothetical protein